ncbi:MAG: SCP2 sterol-binding domain-containing protein [Actinobacteria bacterium]|nr:SCP2 sterol-binding domain-containing protein [Actinomycetota bacterium]
MAKYPFLSDDWFAIVDRLVEEMGAEAPADADLVMNLVVTDTPFGAERHLHVGARHGRGHWGIGHVPDADLAITTDYETAREILLSGDPQAGLTAFMSGKVRIQGDLAKLLTTAQTGGAPAGATALATAILGITE